MKYHVLRVKKGFALIELLVSASILLLLMSVSFFGYRSFGNKVAVSGASQEVAVTIRQAQTYGLSVREATQGGGDFGSGYGVNFDTQNPSNYILFVDKNKNGIYDGTASCTTGSECVEKNVLRNNVSIISICGTMVGGIEACPPAGATALNMMFTIPDTDAHITFTNTQGSILPGIYRSSRIDLNVVNGVQNTQSSVTLDMSGQILVQNSGATATSSTPVVTYPNNINGSICVASYVNVPQLISNISPDQIRTPTYSFYFYGPAGFVVYSCPASYVCADVSPNPVSGLNPFTVSTPYTSASTNPTSSISQFSSCIAHGYTYTNNDPNATSSLFY